MPIVSISLKTAKNLHDRKIIKRNIKQYQLKYQANIKQKQAVNVVSGKIFSQLVVF